MWEIRFGIGGGESEEDGCVLRVDVSICFGKREGGFWVICRDG